MKNLYLTDASYLAVLKRQRQRIADGLDLNLEDSNTAGDKFTEASWGLCSKDKETWPDIADQLFPEDTLAYGRVAPKYQAKGQHCPFDRQDLNPSDPMAGEAWGCFYRCRLFSPKPLRRLEKGESRKNVPREPIPSREEALQLYDKLITGAEARVSRDHEEG